MHPSKNLRSRHKILLIAGLGNPGAAYAYTRHNIGASLIEELAQQNHIHLKSESKFHGDVGRWHVGSQSCWLLMPTTYMNRSGLAIRALMRFYNLLPENLLVVHDELDFPVGTVRFKYGGGHGGHNGVRDIEHQLQTRSFHRLRIGIGRPLDSDSVVQYVLHKPSLQDDRLLKEVLLATIRVLPMCVEGEFEKAMQTLHTPLYRE